MCINLFFLMSLKAYMSHSTYVHYVLNKTAHLYLVLKTPHVTVEVKPWSFPSIKTHLAIHECYSLHKYEYFYNANINTYCVHARLLISFQHLITCILSPAPPSVQVWLCLHDVLTHSGKSSVLRFLTYEHNDDNFTKHHNVSLRVKIITKHH